MAESRKHPQQPVPKGDTTVKFVMKDDPSQELEVVKDSLTSHGLRTLKKYGYVQASKLLQEQAKKAADEDESEEESEQPAKEPAKTAGRARRS
jgi:hypothetical protein